MPPKFLIQEYPTQNFRMQEESISEKSFVLCGGKRRRVKSIRHRSTCHLHESGYPPTELILRLRLFRIIQGLNLASSWGVRLKVLGVGRK